ncbi:hypothetical protein [Oceanithermus sp.]|uniref:hypothetical protein n=1 Tax=Oceanithermus sp. TaxID=2268145 RepID=UPI00257A91EA|nr:hypothetical protein [Oceanithermus sp.]
MSQISNQNTRHANRCRIVMGGKVMAEGTSLQVSEAGGTSGVYTIGSEYPHEHIHNQYQAQGTISALYWKERALEDLSLGKGELVELPTFDIEAYDESDGSVLFVLRGCTLSNRSLGVNANQPISRNVQFMALRVDDSGAAAGVGPVQV